MSDTVRLRIVFALFMSFLMTMLMSAWVTWLNIGWHAEFGARWRYAFMAAWPVAFCVVVVFGPRVQGLSQRVARWLKRG